MDANHTPPGRRYTVNEAAEILGISAEAVRARINRGTLYKEKDADGTVYVRMNGDHTHTNGRTNGDATTDHTVSDSLAFQIMQDQITFLRAELERKDHLLAAALERIPPQLEAPREAREAPETVAEDRSKGDGPHQEEERRPWWRRFFGFE